MPIDLIVTGTGRCGTNYIANVLTSAGILCGKESIFNKTLRFKPELKADSSWYAAAYLDRYTSGNLPTLVHLIRHPLDVIRGWLFDFESYFSAYGSGKERPGDTFILDGAPKIREAECCTDRCILFYCEWNKKIESYKDVFPYILHRVEDDVESLLEKLGIEYTPEKLFSDKKCNTRQKCLLTRREILALLSNSKHYHELVMMMTDYGYEA